MLEHRRSLQVSTHCLAGGKLYSLTHDGSSITVLSTATGLLEANINTRSLLPHTSTCTSEGVSQLGITIIRGKLILYTTLGTFVCFDITRGTVTCRAEGKVKQCKSRLVAAPCRDKDDFIFFTIPGVSLLTALYVSPTSAIASVRVNIRVPDVMDKSKHDVVECFCHPTKPLVFVCMKKGPVHVWSYVALRKYMISKSGVESGSGGGVESGGVSDDEDDGDDQSSQDGGGHDRNKSKLNKQLLPVALLVPPDIEGSKMFHSASVSPCGRMCAVSWGKSVCVYNVQFNKKVTSADWKVQPIGCFTITSSMDINSLGPMAFHPSEPILLQTFFKVDPISKQTSTTVVALTLLMSTLRVISSHPLPHLTLESEWLSKIQCNNEGHVVLTLQSDCDEESTTRLEQFTLSSEFMYRGGWMAPVINKLVVPPDCYVNGDQLLLHKDTSNTPGGNMPLVLILHSDSQVFQSDHVDTSRSSSLKPVYTTFTVYRLKLNLSSQETGGVIPQGILPTFTRKEDLSAVSKWLDFSEDEIVSVGGLFSPTTLLCNELIPGGVSDTNEWYALLKGNAWTMQSAGDSNMVSTPTTCFLRHCDNDLTFSFGNFRDTAFWSGVGAVVKGLDVTSRMLPLFLTLSSSGLEVKTLKVLPGAGSGEESKEHSMEPVSLPIVMDRIWTCPIGGPNRVLFASAIQGGVPAVSGLNMDEQHIFLTEPGSIAVDLTSTTRLTLAYGESILEICWQPYPSAISGDDKMVQRHDCWVCNSRGPMLGVLTSHRVLLLSSSLNILNSYESCRSSAASAMGAKLLAKAVSICWVGSSLVYTLESGAVNYMVAAVVGRKLVNESNFIKQMSCSLFGNDTNNDRSKGRLCTLPISHAVDGYVRLATCLPDRLVYMTREEVGNVSIPSLIIRPCLPLEPLVHGLLQPLPLDIPIAPSSVLSDGGSVDPFAPVTLPSVSVVPTQKNCRSTEHQASIIESLLTIYVPAKPAVGISTEGGALPITQATRKLCFMLCEAGFERLAMIAAGVCSNDRDLTGPDFIHNRWMSPGIKFHMSLRAGAFSTACSDLLAARPGLQELFMDPESYGGGTLPHPDNAYAKQFAASAYVLAACGQRDMARKLADLAGDDEFVALLFMAEERAKSGSQKSNLKNLQEAVKGKNAALYKVLQTVSADEVADKKGQETLEWNLQVSSIGNANRRTTMLALTGTLTNDPASTTTKLDMGPVDRAQRSHASQRGGGLGPPTKLGLLAMDSVEDWLGKSLPEIVVASADSSHLHGLGNDNAKGDDGVEEHLYPGGIERPECWVDDIGTGKEWDKVVGYWRFSDLIRPGEPSFVSSSLPKSRLNMLDLSNFKSPLEVFSDTNSRIKLESTLSAVDPGEDHSKVKELNDVIFSTDPLLNASTLPPVVGMRVKVGRGSAMDVGMYHLDPNRQHLTVELNVLRSETASNLDTEKHVLLQRVGGSDQKTLIWSLSVDNTGKLSWQQGGESANSVSSTEHAINMGPTEDMPVSLWSHIAVVIDSSASHSNVSLFINGDRSVKSLLVLPTVTEDVIGTTTIYVGPNLRGWRISELRFWADSRSAMDIDSMKENYLPLASKRKRMQFRIKGSKQLFGAPASSLLLGEPSDSTPDTEDPTLEKIHLVTRDVSSRKGFGLAAPGSKGGLSAPSGGVGGLASPRGGNRRGAVVQGNLEVEDNSVNNSDSNGNATSMPKSPSLKRMSALAGPTALVSPDGNKTPTKSGLAKPGGISAPSSVKKDSGEILSPAQRRLKNKQQASALPQPQTTVPPVPDASLLSGPKVPLQTKGNPVVNTPSTLEAFPTVGLVWSAPLREIAGYSALDLCKCIRRRPLKGRTALGVPHIVKNPADAGDKDKVTILRLTDELHTLLTAKDSHQLPYSREEISITAESVIVAPSQFGGTKDHIIAYYNQKKLTVLNTTTKTRIVEMPMTAHLIFWTFTNSEELLLITSTGLFKWNVKPSDAPSSRPVKLCDRRDVLDPTRWMDRKVLDAVVHPSGWVIVTTCPRMGPGGAAPATYPQAMSGCRVTCYHSTSKRSLQLEATCGVFLSSSVGAIETSDPQIALTIFHHTNDVQEGKLVVLTLEKITEDISKLDSINLESLVAESSEIVSWSLPLVPQHTHTEEKNHSSFTVPGFMIGWYCLSREEQKHRLCVLTNSGDLYIICPQDRRILKSASVSNESIVTSSLIIGDSQESVVAEPILYMLAGSSGVLSAVSPSQLENS